MSIPYETEEMIRAYEVFLSLGVNRTTEEVSSLCGRPLRTIQQWAKDFNWESRVNEYEQINGRFHLKEPTITNETMMEFIKDRSGLKRPSDANLDADQLVEKYGSMVSKKGKTVAMTRPEYRVLLGGLIREFAERFRLGEVQINTIYEFEKVVKLDLLLMGEATSRNDVNLTGQGVVNNWDIKIEQTIESNPKVQELIGEMWRDYTAPTRDLRKLNADLDQIGYMVEESRVGELASLPSTLAKVELPENIDIIPKSEIKDELIALGSYMLKNNTVEDIT